jgi:hypothetical protein
MVDIKGLDKARVLKALYDHSHVQGSGFLQAVPDGVVTVEYCAGLLAKHSYFDYLHGRVLKVDLSGDEFDERLYDRDCGEGAAQRAVDSVRAEKESGKNTAGNADGEKKELSMEEKVELSRVTIIKILEILEELPPDVGATTCTMLKTMLPGPSMGGLVGLMMGGPFEPPMGGFLGMKTSVHIADELDKAPFPFKGRFGETPRGQR